MAFTPDPSDDGVNTQIRQRYRNQRLTLLEDHDKNCDDDSLEQGSIGEQTHVLMEAKLQPVQETWSMILREPRQRRLDLEAMLGFDFEIFQLDQFVFAGELTDL